MILSRLKLWLVAAASTALIFVGAYVQGRRDAALRARTRNLTGYKDTRKQIDDADIIGDDPAIATRWLRQRKRDRNL